MFGDLYSGRRVFVTGHTGFKGSWLCTWLLNLGADVAGYSLDVASEPSNFTAVGLAERIRHYVGDVRNREQLAESLDNFRPDCVFHLAAQALVRRSYEDPVQTFEVNTIGTMNVLECIRHRPWVQSAVIVTSDKCYRNVEWAWGYRETDVLGGEDPYGASKACAELIYNSYFHSYFKNGSSDCRVATARAGNVIGGGDWAEDRIVPDCVRSWSKGETAVIRSPNATRPWQHVLEPLSGYLWLGAKLWRREPKVVGESYNFGPSAIVDQSVRDLINAISRYWPDAEWAVHESAESPEATLLKLSSDKALADLGWRTVLSFDETVRLTAEWYRRYYEQGAAGMFELAAEQIAAYCNLATEMGVHWTLS